MARLQQMVFRSILLTTLFITAASESLNFSFPAFESNSELILEHSCIALGSLQVTPAVSGSSLNNLSGRALYARPLKLWGEKKKRFGRGNERVVRASFNSTFVINIARKSKKHAGAGMAFILTADSSLPENSQGKWLGMVNETSNGKPEAKIVGVEFDTRKDLGDVDGNHVGLDVNGVESIRQVSLDCVDVDLAEGDDVRVVVLYDGRNLSVFVGEESGSPVMSERIDLSEYLPKTVFVGFSGSTGKYTELNTVKSWEFYSSDVDERSGLQYVSILVPVGLVIILTGVVSGFLWYRKRKRSVGKCEEEVMEDMIEWSSMGPRMFKLKQLVSATGNFNPRNELGRGGFGVVYMGVITANHTVAIKRFTRESTQGRHEFMAEIAAIGNLHHKNLVKLIGWCREGAEFLLVYEYMPNGSLDKLIFPPKGGDDDGFGEYGNYVLSWGRRLSIVRGVAQALDYLHNGCEKRVLHRDIKASNILLDSEFFPKLGDFGLARTVRQREETHHSTKEIAGTPGYMAPECFLTGQATVETDVYAFGVLLLVVVCGRKPVNQTVADIQGEFRNGIVGWVWELYKNGRLIEGVDRRLITKDSEVSADGADVMAVLTLGLACCHPNPHRRPSTKTVVQVLTGESSPPVIPPERPAFVWPAEAALESDCSVSGSQGTPPQVVELSGR